MSVKSRSPKLTPGAKLIGYARVSTEQQDLTRQERALKAARCDVIFADKASGKSMKGRPQLDAALSKLAPGDCLVVAEWDRATRSMWDGMEIIRQVIDAGATVKVLDFPSLDLTTPEGRGFLAMFSAMAERERQRLIARTHEGRKIAVARGQKMGRPHLLTPLQKAEARKMLVCGQSTRTVAGFFNVSHNTIARLA